MLDGCHVVAVVPAGRRRYLQILVAYLQAQRPLLDACELWCNTQDAEDRTYLGHLAAHDHFFRVVESDIPVNGIYSIHQFFRHCTDPQTVYIRFDDDICWIAADAIEKLVRFRLENPQYALVFANIINNSICSYLHQRLGCVPLREGIATYDCLGPVNWESGYFARLAHETFLQHWEDGHLDAYRFPKWVAWQYERISINCICWHGQAFSLFQGKVGIHEEQWLTMDYPFILRKPTAICGTALVAHFAYHPQRLWLETHTSLLQKYQQMASRLAQS